MNRDDVSWRGYWPACPTPFHQDGSYDPESHRALLELYLALGVHGVLINGTTGEWFSQTADERRLVAETAIDQVAGRVPVVVGCAAYTAREWFGKGIDRRLICQSLERSRAGHAASTADC